MCRLQQKKEQPFLAALCNFYFFLQQDGKVLAAATVAVASAFFVFSFFTSGQSGVFFNLHSFTIGQSGVPFNGQSFNLSFPAKAKNEPPASIIVAVAIPKNLLFIKLNIKLFVGYSNKANYTKQPYLAYKFPFKLHFLFQQPLIAHG